MPVENMVTLPLPVPFPLLNTDTINTKKRLSNGAGRTRDLVFSSKLESTITFVTLLLLVVVLSHGFSRGKCVGLPLRATL